MIKHIHSDVMTLTDHMYSKRLISEGQMDIIKSKKSDRQKIIELLMRIQKKGWQSLMELIKAIKQIEPLYHLAKEIDEQMTEQTNEPMTEPMTESMTEPLTECSKLFCIVLIVTMIRIVLLSDCLSCGHEKCMLFC